MTYAFLWLWLSAFPLILSPGPANISLASVGMTFGFRRGLPFLICISIGTTTVLLLVAAGMTGVLLAQPVLEHLVTAFAAMYMLYLAWKIASAPIHHGARSTAELPTMLSGLVLAIANPKAFAALGAIYVGHNFYDGSMFMETTLKLAVLTMAIFMSGTGWLLFGSLFSSLTSQPVIGRMVYVSFAILLLISVGIAALG